MLGILMDNHYLNVYVCPIKKKKKKLYFFKELSYYYDGLIFLATSKI